METKIKDFELKQHLEEIIEDRNPDKKAVVDDMALIVNEINTNGSYHLNLSINARLYDLYKNLNLSDIQIKKRTYDRLKESQKKHGFKSIETMIASALEKYYDHD